MIIPTCNRNELLGKCLDRLMPGAQTLPSEAYEVIVSDDGAGEAAESFCRQRYPWVRYVRGLRRGPAANRNNGASLAAGEWLVFTDDDCLPDAGWLHAYVRAIDAYPDCKAFEGAIWPDDWELLKKDMAECPVNTKGGCFWSANIMAEHQLFQSIGGFDEQFLIAAQEDQDLHWRLQALTPLAFVSKAQVIHPVRIQPFFFTEKNKWLRLQSLVYRKRKEGMKPVSVLGISLSSVFRALVNGIKKGKYRQCFHLACHLIYQLFALPIILLRAGFAPYNNNNH